MPRTKSSVLDKDLIRDLAKLLEETGLGEIEIQQEGFKVRVARPVTHAMAHTGAQMAAAPPASATPSAGPEPRKPADITAHPGVVKSPMVGTAYCAPAPGSPPFVQPGDAVKEGQIILIIEAMKTMNQIPAPRDGQILNVFVTDGQPVEYGEPLFVIE